MQHLNESPNDDPYRDLPPDLVAVLQSPPKGAYLLPGEEETLRKVATWAAKHTCEHTSWRVAVDSRYEFCTECRYSRRREQYPRRVNQITEEMVDRAVAAFWAVDRFEHTKEETRAAMRDALSAAFSTTRAEGDQWHCEHRGIAQVVEQRNAGPYCAECGAIIERARSRKDAP